MSPIRNIHAFCCLVLAALAGCEAPRGGVLPRVDGRTDPALLAALDDPILVDPTLSDYSNRTVVRPAETAGGAVYPLGGRPSDLAGCIGELERDPIWARRLPPALAMTEGARLIEAAGRNGPDCTLQVTRFRVARTPAAVVDLYFGRAVRDGLSATQLARGEDQLLFGGAGRRSYLVLARPVAGGAEVGLVARADAAGWPPAARRPRARR